MRVASLTTALLFAVAVPAVAQEQPVVPPVGDDDVATTEAVTEHVMVAPTDLDWTDLNTLAEGVQIAVIEGELNETEPLVFRLRIPANTRLGVHTHPSAEHVTVLSGTLYFGTGNVFDEAAAQALAPGAFVMMPPEAPMFAFTRDEEAIIQVHGEGPWVTVFLEDEDAMETDVETLPESDSDMDSEAEPDTDDGVE